MIIIFTFKKPDIYIKNYTFYILISLLIIIKILIPKYSIYESHNILIQDQQIQELAKYTDKNYKELLINNLDEYYGYYDEISIDQLNDDYFQLNLNYFSNLAPHLFDQVHLHTIKLFLNYILI